MTHAASRSSKPRRDSCRAAKTSSEHIHSRKTRLTRDAVPEVDGKSDIASPQRIPPTADGDLGSAPLNDRRHRELAGTVKPNRILCASVELEECVAVPTSAMAEIRAL